ncbi:hypothetical protein GF336_00035 [Candidatus Woesearchaeota archaeon]|nr:hypothetical protein [Candidatus Woesearchaeota archaeon]
MKGTVKWYNRRKGYGFIKGEDEKEYFVHFSAIEEGTFIRDNDLVEFEPAETEKGLQARDVKLVKKASDIAAEEGGEEASEEGAKETFGDEEPEAEAPAEEQPAEEAKPEEGAEQSEESSEEEKQE